MWDQDLQKWARGIEDFATTHFEIYRSEHFKTPKVILDSIMYSLNGGGKRFRPLLAMLVAEHYEADPMRVLPWACAVEMVHTYSLIHDDLPCMDNDDYRRGRLTNHKVYGDSIALLAGDALLTEAFSLICKFYQTEPDVAVKLLDRLSSASGLQGMISGQVEDMQADKIKADFNKLMEIHKLKTGQLIRVSLEGAGIACGADQHDLLSLKFYGEYLGLAFQIKDDLLDATAGDEDQKNFVALVGRQQTEELLQDISRKAKTYLNKLKKPNVRLLQMVDYNLSRNK